MGLARRPSLSSSLQVDPRGRTDERTDLRGAPVARHVPQQDVTVGGARGEQVPGRVLAAPLHVVDRDVHLARHFARQPQAPLLLEPLGRHAHHLEHLRAADGRYQGGARVLRHRQAVQGFAQLVEKQWESWA